MSVYNSMSGTFESGLREIHYDLDDTKKTDKVSFAVKDKILCSICGIEGEQGLVKVKKNKIFETNKILSIKPKTEKNTKFTLLEKTKSGNETVSGSNLLLVQSREWKDIAKEIANIAVLPFKMLFASTALLVPMPFLFPILIPTIALLIPSIPVFGVAALVVSASRQVFMKYSNCFKEVTIDNKQYYVQEHEYKNVISGKISSDGTSEGKKTKQLDLLSDLKTILDERIQNIFSGKAPPFDELNGELKDAIQSLNQEDAMKLFNLGANPNINIPVEREGKIVIGSLYTHAKLNGWNDLTAAMDNAEHVVKTDTYLEENYIEESEHDSTLSNIQLIANAVGENNPGEILKLINSIKEDQNNEMIELKNNQKTARELNKKNKKQNKHYEENINHDQKSAIVKLTSMHQAQLNNLFTDKIVYFDRKSNEYKKSDLYEILLDNRIRIANEMKFDKFDFVFFHIFRSPEIKPEDIPWLQLAAFRPSINRQHRKPEIEASSPEEHEQFVYGQKDGYTKEELEIMSCLSKADSQKGAEDLLNLLNQSSNPREILEKQITMSATVNIMDTKNVKKGRKNNETFFFDDSRDKSKSFHEFQKGSLYDHILAKAQENPELNLGNPWMHLKNLIKEKGWTPNVEIGLYTTHAMQENTV